MVMGYFDNLFRGPNFLLFNIALQLQYSCTTVRSQISYSKFSRQVLAVRIYSEIYILDENVLSWDTSIIFFVGPISFYLILHYSYNIHLQLYKAKKVTRSFSRLAIRNYSEIYSLNEKVQSRDTLTISFCGHNFPYCDIAIQL